MEHDVNYARTVAFVTLVGIQLTHSICVRSIRTSVFLMGSHNFTLYLCCLLSLGMTVIGIYVGPLARWVELESMKAIDWVVVLIGSVIHVIWMEFEKIVLRFIKRISERRKLAKAANAHLINKKEQSKDDLKEVVVALLDPLAKISGDSVKLESDKLEMLENQTNVKLQEEGLSTAISSV